MTTLAVLVRTERDRQGLSLREVAELSGGIVSHSSVHAIEHGARSEVGDETLDGLAKALGVPIDRLRRAAGVRTPDVQEPFVLPRRASRLSRKEREVVLSMVDALLEAKKRR
jgi:transcriptional regulator with XRE-family HTH domain